MKQAIQRPRFRQRILARPQIELLAGASGEIAMDYVGRYECLQADFDHICQQIGLEPQLLGRKNVSNHDTYKTYYDQPLLSAVQQFYQADLEQFAYQFGATTDSN